MVCPWSLWSLASITDSCEVKTEAWSSSRGAFDCCPLYQQVSFNWQGYFSWSWITKFWKFTVSSTLASCVLMCFSFFRISFTLSYFKTLSSYRPAKVSKDHIQVHSSFLVWKSNRIDLKLHDVRRILFRLYPFEATFRSCGHTRRSRKSFFSIFMKMKQFVY